MLGDVPERLLRGPVQAECEIDGHRSKVLVRPEGHAHPMRILELLTVPVESGHQSDVLEHPGVELVREMPDFLHDARRALL
jgi:hypothetical protein